MREYKIIASITAVLLLIVVFYFFRRALDPGAGEFDELAVTRIVAACAYKPECKINLGELSPDQDWDTFYEFADGTSPSVLETLLPSSGLHAPEGKRLIVLTAFGHIQHHFYEPSVPAYPIAHQLVFFSPQQRTIKLPRNTWLWATRKPRWTNHRDPADGLSGTYYSLSPDDR